MPRRELGLVIFNKKKCQRDQKQETGGMGREKERRETAFNIWWFCPGESLFLLHSGQMADVHGIFVRLRKMAESWLHMIYEVHFGLFDTDFM